MKKTSVLLAIIFICGILAGGLGVLSLKENRVPSAPLAAASAQPSAEKGLKISCLEAAIKVAQAFRDNDYDTLSAFTHPEKGVIFVPYSTVDFEKNLSFTPAQVFAFYSDKTRYIWGLSDGSGAPIELTPKDYMAKYVYDRDYLGACVIGLDTVAKTGNSLENVEASFPGASFVEFHIPAEDEKYEGLDWGSLKLVFERYKEEYYLVAVIHSQWTI